MKKIIYIISLIILFFIGGLAGYLLKNNRISQTVDNTNVAAVNVSSNTVLQENNCHELNEPWWPTGKFQNGIYQNSSFGYKVTLPAGIYLQSDSHTQRECTDHNPFLESTNYATFGDKSSGWQITIQSAGNKDALDLEAWINRYTKLDTAFNKRNFGSNEMLYGERTPLDPVEESYQSIAIMKTGSWIQIITYEDKQKDKPKQADFEAVLKSIEIIK